MKLIVVTGDLLEQKVDAIVNPWNRNLIPWWLLLPKGASGAIKKRAGLRPFVELGGRSEDEVQQLIEEECRHSDYGGKIVIVHYRAKEWPNGHCYCDLRVKSPDLPEDQGFPKDRWCDRVHRRFFRENECRLSCQMTISTAH
jgi:hypothetical protein